ncbi:hypothetical protein CAPTEDRAFT_188741 [Capitella teleta]|uniref:Uncharacterized protein n=1 Tax=Capitella teleta TaxID=283909 RepID=R7T668_CAPTE|nr:hypothetical protein CAPTEDRAFT_188741 [Capitella teleta]|eukprot:ELT89024.1 hypothetical protein CAPTEDRAFT_188741 [Capitella teleta]
MSIADVRQEQALPGAQVDKPPGECLVNNSLAVFQLRNRAFFSGFTCTTPALVRNALGWRRTDAFVQSCACLDVMTSAVDDERVCVYITIHILDSCFDDGIQQHQLIAFRAKNTMPGCKRKEIMHSEYRG